MPRRIAIAVVLFLGLMLAGRAHDAAAVDIASGETREYFRDWLAACRNDGSGYCSALAYVPDPSAPGGIAAQLRVALPRPGADPQIVFSPIPRLDGLSDLADLEQAMTVRVDDTPAIQLLPGAGFGRAGGLNDYGIADDTVAAELIRRMKQGAAITVDYVDQAGRDARFTFSLMGLTAALRFIDDRQARAAGDLPAIDPEAPRHDRATMAGFDCRGNEPFWTLTIKGTTATYSRPTDTFALRDHALNGAMQARDFFKPPLFVWRGRGELASGDIVAMITGDRCLDTMSDGEGQTAFDYTARISMPNGELLTGCCNAREKPAAADPAGLDGAPIADVASKGPDDWSRLIVDLLPAINACLERTPGADTRVTKAWPMNRGMVGVRAGDDGGRRWNCVAPADGGEVRVFAPVPEGAETVPGETTVVFTPSPGSPPAGACFRHERLMNPGTATLIGWLSYHAC